MKTIALTVMMAGGIFGQQTGDPGKVTFRVEQLTSEAKGAMTFDFVGGSMISGKTVKGAPYSAEAVTETTQTLADGNRIVHKSSAMQYRDSDGRERREEAIGRISNWDAQGQPAKTVFISDPVAKVSYTLDPVKRTARKSSIAETVFHVATPGTTFQTFTTRSDQQTIALNGGRGEISIVTGTTTAPNRDAKVEPLGKQMFDGVEAEGTRTTITIPAGQVGNERPIDIVDERWYSNELQMTVMSRHSDPRMGETAYRLNGISRTEPLRSLFEVPSDYTIAEMEYRRVIKKDEIF
jgi:hypothetical protein